MYVWCSVQSSLSIVSLCPVFHQLMLVALPVLDIAQHHQDIHQLAQGIHQHLLNIHQQVQAIARLVQDTVQHHQVIVPLHQATGNEYSTCSIDDSIVVIDWLSDDFLFVYLITV